MTPETVFIGFGSNVGDRQEFCDRAIALMGMLPLSQFVQVSSYYETQPIDPEGVLGQTWFYNGVVKIETSLHSDRLFEICQETERALGRDEENRSGPRTMDFDILFYGQHIIEVPGLTIPHPRLHLRRFVLEPLVELDPTWHHPILKQTVRTLLENVDDPSEIRRVDLIPGSRYGNRPSCFSLPPHTV